MIYAAVLAGGTGKRMNRDDLPKQFLPLGDISILAHTTKSFLIHQDIDKVILAVPSGWLAYAEDLIKKELIGRELVSRELAGRELVGGELAGRELVGRELSGIGLPDIEYVTGGADRNASLMAVVDRIEGLFGVGNDDIIVTHDAVRPFVTQRIISENIEACREYGATATAIALTDTPIISDDGGGTILEIPARSRYFLAQTPQTFNIKLLKKAYASLLDDDKAILTDASKMFVMQSIPVRIVKGENYNIKITTSFDYTMALAYINEHHGAE